MPKEMMCGAGGVGREHGNNLNSTAASPVDRGAAESVLDCIKCAVGSAEWPVDDVQDSAQLSVFVEDLETTKRGYNTQTHMNCYYTF